MNSTNAVMRSAESSGQLMVESFLASSASPTPSPSYSAAEAEEVLFSLEAAVAALEEVGFDDLECLLADDEGLRRSFDAAGALRDALLDGSEALEIVESVVELLRERE